MAPKVGINGFGRIGRLVLRAAIAKGVQVSLRTQERFNIKSYRDIISLKFSTNSVLDYYY